MEMQTAIVQSALDTAQLFKDNMALARNLPQASRIVVDPPREPGPIRVQLESNQPLATATANAPASPIVQAATTAGASSLAKTAAIVGLSLLGGGGIAALGTGLGAYMNRPAQPAVPVVNVQGDASLLQHLEEQGYHLPAKGSK
jgi:hypothetical protein